MNAPVIMPATQELTEAYFGRRPEHTFRGYVGLLDGKPVGLCGVYTDGGHPVAFSDIGPELRPHRRTIAKGIRLVMDMLEDTRIPVFAIMNRDEPTAPRLLEKLGFVPTGRETPDGTVLVRSR